MIEIREQILKVRELTEELDEAKDQLENTVEPHLKAWQEFVAEYAKQTRERRQLGPYASLWSSRDAYPAQLGGYDYEVSTEESSRTVLVMSGSDDQGGYHTYRIPMTFFTDPGATKNSARHLWDNEYDARQDEKKAQTEAKEQAEYERLRVKFETGKTVSFE